MDITGQESGAALVRNQEVASSILARSTNRTNNLLAKPETGSTPGSSRGHAGDALRRGALALVAVAALAGGACSSAALASASPVPAEAARGKAARAAGAGECLVRVAYDPAAGLLHAVYETPETCGAERPRWVPTDFNVDHVEMELRDLPHGRRFGCAPEGCLGWYMRPLGPVGGPYTMQARASEGGGHASFTVSIARDGALTVQQ